MPDDAIRLKSVVRQALPPPAVGTPVYDFRGRWLGRVKRFDNTHHYLVMERGRFWHKEMYVPLGSIADWSDDGIQLYISKRGLESVAFDQPPVLEGSSIPHQSG